MDEEKNGGALCAEQCVQALIRRILDHNFFFSKISFVSTALPA